MPELTDTEAQLLRALYKSTELYPQRDPERWTYKRLQEKFNCSRDTVWKAITGETHSGRF